MLSLDGSLGTGPFPPLRLHFGKPLVFLHCYSMNESELLPGGALEEYQNSLPPKLQILNLVDFPQEILEQIYDAAERRDIVSLAHTCKMLFNSGYTHLLRVRFSIF